MLDVTRPHIILMIGDDGIVVVPHEIANTAPFFAPIENKNTVSIIKDFIDRYPDAHITLCADNLAQDYRIETIPPLYFFDRINLIKRRLQTHFPLARLTSFKPLAKEKNRVLLIGLNSSNAVLHWADRVRARLPRILLLPVEGARLFGRMVPDSVTGWAMLISRQKSGGFRQIVTYNGNLVFTRLTPLAIDTEDQSPIIARDIKASLDYLTRQGLQNAQELSVTLLMSETHIDLGEFAPLNLKSIHCLSLLTAAQILRLPFAPENEEADVFFAASIAISRPVLPLMLPDTKTIWQNKRIHFWGMRVATCCLVFSISLAVWNAVDLFSTLYHTQQETAHLYSLQNELAQAQADAAPLTEPLGRLRQALARQHIYEQETSAPWHGLNEITVGLTDGAKIIRLDWEKASDMASEKITLALRVAPPDAQDNRAATVTAFTNVTQNIALAAGDYDVAVTKPPFPALPQETITTETGNGDPDPAGEIVLQRKMP